MENSYLDKNRYISSQFGYSLISLEAMLLGLYGEKKQLFADVMLSLDMDFIENIKNNKHFSKNDDIKYITVEDAETLFEFRTGQMKNWKSEKKKLLISCLTCTPECFVFHVHSQRKSSESIKALFPNVVNRKPKKKLVKDVS